MRSAGVSISASEDPARANTRRVLLLLNRRASRAKDAAPQIQAWFAEQALLTVIDVNDEDAERSLERLGADADLIVIGGGDGTISKALPFLLERKKPFAVLPLGTANDFARTIGLPADPLEATEVALNGASRAIDVGTVNGHPYLNVASVGAAAKVAEAQSKEKKARWRVLAYALALFEVWRNLRPLFVEIGIDGEAAWSGSVYQIGIGNGRYHGGGLLIAPDAAIDDGMLDLYLVQPGRFSQLLASLLHLKFSFARPKVLKRRRGNRVTLSTMRPHPVNADGELVTETPAKFTVLPAALTVMVSRES